MSNCQHFVPMTPIINRDRCVNCGENHGFPTIWGRPANPGETEDAYIERVMHENYVTESGCTPHGSME